MAQDDVYTHLTTIMRRLFKDEAITASPEMTAKDVKGWDSLKHIRFVLEVEKEFGIKFKTSEIASFKTVGELVDIIATKST